MAIIKGLDLSLTSLEYFTMLLHGDFNTFKTWLTGAFLACAIRAGKRARFWHIEGEENIKTLGFFPEIDPKEHIWTLQTWQDIEEAQKEAMAEPLDALGVDSGVSFADHYRLKATDGRDRPLRVPKGKGDHSTDWTDMHFNMDQTLQRLRQCAKGVIMTCPSDLSAHHLDPNTDTWTKERRVTPNLPGNEATRCPGWFNYVGYCDVEGVTGGVKRLLHFEYSKKFVSRACVARQFTGPITVETQEPKDGYKGWESIAALIEGRMQ